MFNTIHVLIEESERALTSHPCDCFVVFVFF